jgi:hypothetical protein
LFSHVLQENAIKIWNIVVIRLQLGLTFFLHRDNQTVFRAGKAFIL